MEILERYRMGKRQDGACKRKGDHKGLCKGNGQIYGFDERHR